MKHSRRALLGPLAAAPLAPAVMAGAVPAVTASTVGPTVRYIHNAYDLGYLVTPEDWAATKRWFANHSTSSYFEPEPDPAA